ncbi:hypothetical protein M413DRAFT_263543 [Hebeloma cylindrosporum]|uniref:DUF6534 domain-containing protein n=1 Tax=Hebeloma cylindrosporum TaxID=76867 RepID=A0A0C2Z0X8_HEBCY|nr:hypothetical protein M413DRAFT_263543 [Hebeloma cylindrosporum h7]
MPNLNTMDTTYGALFIGLILSAILYGVALLQTFMYYRRHPEDSRIMKSMVFLLCALDTGHLILCTMGLYDYLISNFNNPDALVRTTWTMNLQFSGTGLIGIIVQCFFARRVRIMSGNVILTVIILILASVEFSLGILFTVNSFILGNNTKLAKLFWITNTGLGCAAAADIMIAAALCYYLNKSRTGSSRADSLIAILIAYSVTTGLISSVIAVLCVILFAAMPNNLIGYALFLIIGKCYVNSLLAALNCRDSLRERLDQRPNTLLRLTLTPVGALTSMAHITEDPLSSDSTNTKYPYTDTLEDT